MESSEGALLGTEVTPKVDWEKVRSIVPGLLAPVGKETVRMSLPAILNHPKRQAAEITLFAINALEGEDVMMRGRELGGDDSQGDYLEKYKGIPRIFNEAGEVDSSLWEIETWRGGRHTVDNMRLSSKASPNVKVFVKNISNELLSESDRRLTDDADEARDIFGDLTVSEMEEQVLKSDFPGVIHPLEIVGNKVAMPFIDYEVMGRVGSSAGSMEIRRGGNFVNVPLSTEQSLSTAKKYLDLLIGINELGYAVPGQEDGDIEIRLNPSTGEVVFYDFSFCFPTKPISEIVDELDRKYLQLKIDRLAYGRLSSPLANIFGLDKSSFTLLENSPIKSLPNAAEIVAAMKKIEPSSDFDKKTMAEKLLLIKRIAESVAKGMVQIKDGGLKEGEKPSSVQMLLGEVRNSAVFGGLGNMELNTVFRNAITGLDEIPTKRGMDANTVSAAQSLSSLFHEALTLIE